MSSAEGMCSSVHHPSGLSIFYSESQFELCASAQYLEQLGNTRVLLGLGFGGAAPHFQPLCSTMGDAAEAISSFYIFVSLSVKCAEGNCPFLLNGLTAEDEKYCIQGRWDYSRLRLAEKCYSALHRQRVEGEIGFAGGLWQTRAPTQAASSFS